MLEKLLLILAISGLTLIITIILPLLRQISELLMRGISWGSDLLKIQKYKKIFQLLLGLALMMPYLMLTYTKWFAKSSDEKAITKQLTANNGIIHSLKDIPHGWRYIAGIVVLVLVPIIIPVVLSIVRPFLKAILKSFMKIRDHIIEFVAELGEQISDLYAEAKAELYYNYNTKDSAKTQAEYSIDYQGESLGPGIQKPESTPPPPKKKRRPKRTTGNE